MRAIIQRVSQAQVLVNKEIVGKIGPGWLILLGVCEQDNESHVQLLADKIINLRALSDANGKMNLDLKQINGSVLVVSQFTLYGDCKKGRRPSFTGAANPTLARQLYESFSLKFKSNEIETQNGIFATDMDVQLHNDGPVTFWLDTDHF